MTRLIYQSVTSSLSERGSPLSDFFEICYSITIFPYQHYDISDSNDDVTIYLITAMQTFNKKLPSLNSSLSFVCRRT